MAKHKLSNETFARVLERVSDEPEKREALWTSVPHVLYKLRWKLNLFEWLHNLVRPPHHSLLTDRVAKHRLFWPGDGQRRVQFNMHATPYIRQMQSNYIYATGSIDGT